MQAREWSAHSAKGRLASIMHELQRRLSLLMRAHSTSGRRRPASRSMLPNLHAVMATKSFAYTKIQHTKMQHLPSRISVDLMRNRRWLTLERTQVGRKERHFDLVHLWAMQGGRRQRPAL